MCEQWEVVRLSDHVDITIGGTPSRAMPAFWAEKPDGHPWLAIADLREKYLSDAREHITELGVRSSNVKLIPAGSTVMSFKLSVGRTAVTSAPMFSNEAIAAFLPRSTSVNSAWLYHVLPRAARTVATDSAVKGATLNKTKMAEMSVSLPAPSEQSAIADVLDTLDTTIRQTEAIIEKLRLVKQGLLHDLLTRGIDANGELRPPQGQAPHLYKDSPLGWIPRAWDVFRLADYMAADITYGIVQAGPHIDGGVPYIRTGDMSGDRLDAPSLLRTSRRIADSYARSEVRSGEIVIAIRATVGKVLPIPPELDGANLTQGTARLAPNGRTDAQFLLWALRHQRAQDSISAEIKGTTFAEITLAALREVPLAAPIDAQEQQRIGEQLRACEARISAEVGQKQKLMKQKSGLADDLLTGRVRVTSLLDVVTA